VKNKNTKVLVSFIRFCDKNPDQRFWQALRNWAKVPFIFIGDKLSSEAVGGRDTFYFKGKTK
jgi:hypothetical protein